MSPAEAHQERDRLLALGQIETLRDQDNSRLTGGQRRFLPLAVAMAGSLPMLILDEPTNDLDPLRRRLVWDVLRQVNREQGTTIFFITHDAIEAEKVIERVGIMREGALVASRYEAGAISLTVTMVMAGLGPVVVPASRLPRFLVWLGWINPATYAASALRQAVIGPSTERLA